MSHAIIGCGRVAPNHVYGVTIAGETILACCDIDKQALDAFAKKYTIPRKYSDYRDLLADKEIDTVSVCTDHGSHAEIAIAALNAGKHVIVEKPMALSVADGKAMLVARDKAQRVLAVVSQHRYDPLVRKVIELLHDDVFGKITMISGLLNSYKDIGYYKDSFWRGTLDKEGGSTLINQAIHTLDIMVLIMGMPIIVKTKMANLKFKNVIETEDTLVSLMQFKNGALGTLSSTNTSVKFWDSKIEITGLKGNITFKTGFPFYVSDLELEDKEKAKRMIGIFEKIASQKEDLPPTQDYYGISHRYQLKNFLEASKHRAQLEMPPEEALKTLETVLQIYAAARQ